MAIKIKTNNASELLEDLKSAIKEDKIETWAYDDGYFTHSPQQWKHKAWFKPQVKEEGLNFGIYPPKSKSISSSIYAIYHGRFIEMMLAHFDNKFKKIEATALIANPDYIAKK